jgi:peptide-methionine (R)-S-oxide reductase
MHNLWMPGIRRATAEKNMSGKRDSSNVALQSRLTADQLHITQEKGTEPAFTGKYHDCKSDGTYVCNCCGTPLFESKTKYDSGSGWPSFWAPAQEGSIDVETDTSHGMMRKEVLCAKCSAHLGHVFADGPEPTGQRFCINSASLDLEPDEDDQS